jgi:protoporphyrinogen/coproporphyrinogen III oxidase
LTVDVPSIYISQITTSSHFSFNASHVVSTLSPPILNTLLPPSLPLPHLAANPSSSVTVVNLVFPPSPSGNPIHPPGFGYLIPRPSSGYDTSNPGILGTVFDSSALSEQDTGRLTKLTVMLGGPHPLTSSHTSLPVILGHLASHLGHSLPEPLFMHTHSHVSCIPTLSVGHLAKMDELRAVLKASPWNGRLEIIGAGVGGVSVGDCVEAGKRAGCVWG